LSAVLVRLPGGSLQLQGLLLSDAALPNPQESPSLAFQPAGLALGAGSTLLLRDVLLLVSSETLQQYNAYLGALPYVVIVTDGASFLHIRSYSSKAAAAAGNSSSNAAAVEAHSVTLIAPAGSTIGGTPLTVLQSLAATIDSRGSSNNAPVDEAALEAARGDAAGVVLATDSYVLGATNATLLRQLKELNAPQMSAQRPLLICLATNVTLFPKAWGTAWPAAGVAIRRHLLLLGSSVRRPSIDLGMQVRQMVLDGPSSNVTLFNVALENLAYGDEGSGKNAEGTSIVMPSQLWAFDFRR
jgi:hypothetical protein